MRAIWYDKEAGSAWRLDHDAGGAGVKTAYTMTGTGDKQCHGKPDKAKKDKNKKAEDIASLE